MDPLAKFADLMTPLVRAGVKFTKARGVEDSELPTTMYQEFDLAKTVPSVYGKTVKGWKKHACAVLVAAIQGMQFGSWNEHVNKKWFGGDEKDGEQKKQTRKPSRAAEVITIGGKAGNPMNAQGFVGQMLTAAICLVGATAGIPYLHDKKLFGKSVPAISISVTIGIAWMIGLNEIYGKDWWTDPVPDTDPVTEGTDDKKPKPVDNKGAQTTIDIGTDSVVVAAAGPVVVQGSDDKKKGQDPAAPGTPTKTKVTVMPKPAGGTTTATKQEAA